MEDVKGLMRAIFRANEVALGFVIAYVAGAVLWSGERSGRDLAKATLAAVGVGAAVGIAVGVLAIVGFESAWERLHEIIFTNDLWLLDPRTDRLIQMFPESFWQEATFIVVGLALAEAVALVALAGAYLWFTRTPRAHADEAGAATADDEDTAEAGEAAEVEDTTEGEDEPDEDDAGAPRDEEDTSEAEDGPAEAQAAAAAAAPAAGAAAGSARPGLHLSDRGPAIAARHGEGGDGALGAVALGALRRHGRLGHGATALEGVPRQVGAVVLVDRHARSIPAGRSGGAGGAAPGALLAPVGDDQGRARGPARRGGGRGRPVSNSRSMARVMALPGCTQPRRCGREIEGRRKDGQRGMDGRS